jgi:hypothetical protein
MDMASSKITGSYTTKRDQGLTYTYEATYQSDGAGLTWMAKVWRDGNFKGTPNGKVLTVSGIDVANTVRGLVEAAIESMAGINR